MQNTSLIAQDPAHYHSGNHSIFDAVFFDGSYFITGRKAQYPPSIEATDLLEVDCDVRSVGRDGLYLLVCDGDSFSGGKPYPICRRFQRTGSGLVYDQTGHGDWVPADEKLMSYFQVCGRIKNVFKPAVAT